MLNKQLMVFPIKTQNKKKKLKQMSNVFLKYTNQRTLHHDSTDTLAYGDTPEILMPVFGRFPQKKIYTSYFANNILET